MFAHGLNSVRGWKALLAAGALLALLSPSPAAAQTGKQKQATAPAGATAKPDDKVSFDLSKIVWPNPPAIARIQWKSQFTGEKIDPTKFNKNTAKQKQKWMDRLAGTKTQTEKNADIPFQLSAALRNRG